MTGKERLEAIQRALAARLTLRPDPLAPRPEPKGTEVTPGHGRDCACERCFALRMRQNGR